MQTWRKLWPHAPQRPHIASARRRIFKLYRTTRVPRRAGNALARPIKRARLRTLAMRRTPSAQTRRQTRRARLTQPSRRRWRLTTRQNHPRVAHKPIKPKPTRRPIRAVDSSRTLSIARHAHAVARVVAATITICAIVVALTKRDAKPDSIADARAPIRRAARRLTPPRVTHP